MDIKYIATSTFGLEAVVKRELEKLGCENIKVSDGRLDFTGGIEKIAQCNIWLRSADRLMINFGEFNAYTFEELFQGVKALPWGDILGVDANFTITGKSVKSKLFSVSDCQAITKKAIVEKLREKYNIDWFDEDGPKYKIQVGILKDAVTLAIDTTGPGLNKRGYRENSVIAPLKETIASALVDLSYWKKDRILADALCGSGTIPIEAAMMARNIAPGLRRNFAAEKWPHIPEKIWKQERAAAYGAIDTDLKLEIYSSDIDPKAIEQAELNAKLAGVDDCISFSAKPVKEFVAPGEYGVMISNPPYGERIGNIAEITEIHTDLKRFLDKNLSWSMYLITTNEDLEKQMGRRATKKRKLYNGNVKTDYYQFVGPRPPRKEI